MHLLVRWLRTSVQHARQERSGDFLPKETMNVRVLRSCSNKALVVKCRNNHVINKQPYTCLLCEAQTHSELVHTQYLLRRLRYSTNYSLKYSPLRYRVLASSAAPPTQLRQRDRLAQPRACGHGSRRGLRDKPTFRSPAELALRLERIRTAHQTVGEEQSGGTPKRPAGTIRAGLGKWGA